MQERFPIFPYILSIILYPSSVPLIPQSGNSGRHRRWVRQHTPARTRQPEQRLPSLSALALRPFAPRSDVTQRPAPFPRTPFRVAIEGDRGKSFPPMGHGATPHMSSPKFPSSHNGVRGGAPLPFLPFVAFVAFFLFARLNEKGVLLRRTPFVMRFSAGYSCSSLSMAQPHHGQ